MACTCIMSGISCDACPSSVVIHGLQPNSHRPTHWTLSARRRAKSSAARVTSRGSQVRSHSHHLMQTWVVVVLSTCESICVSLMAVTFWEGIAAHVPITPDCLYNASRLCALF